MKFIITLFAVLTLSVAHAQDESPKCEYLKQSKNTPVKSINIVIVPSAFGDDVEKFASTIKPLWDEVSEFTPFSANVESMNVILAKVPHTEEGYCEFSTANDRVLECDGLKAARLADKCYSGTNRYTITIHNSTRHGGSGARFGASATLARSSAAIIAHELGHSIFNLADEYADPGKDSGKNCSSKSTCDAWKDLIDAGLATCEPGCEAKLKYTSPDTLMGSLSEKSFGHVNSRIMCCQFKKLTGQYPQFCDTYQSVGQGLDAFCR